jgi:hypothetical protein
MRLSREKHDALHARWEDWYMKNFKEAPPWEDILIPAASLPPSGEKLHKVIAELDVEKSPRYAPKPGATFCNIFASDVITAMGFGPGHWVHEDGSPAKLGEGTELSANGMARWFGTHGAGRGWMSTDKDTAFSAAERGHLVVVTYDSKSGKPGHIAVMLPEGTIAQAGRTNFVGRTLREGFGALPVSFWVQMRGAAHKP